MSKFWMVLIAALSLAACGDNDVGPRDDGLPDAPGGPSVHQDMNDIKIGPEL